MIMAAFARYDLSKAKNVSDLFTKRTEYLSLGCIKYVLLNLFPTI
jgi:hypothetical protein